MRSLGYVLLLLALAGCQVKPVTRPVMTDVPAGMVVSSPTADNSAPGTPGADPGVPRADAVPALRCRGSSDEAVALTRSVVETLMREGDWYAALAQVDALPGNAADVALMRADILRELSPMQSVRWYEALLRQCREVRAEHGLALLAARAGRLTEAVARLQRVVAAYPLEPRYRNDLGVLHLQTGADDLAAFELRTAHELAKADPQPVFNLLLRSLVMNNVSEWQLLSQRWSPPAETRERLAGACETVMTQRLAGQRVRCPIDPRRS